MLNPLRQPGLLWLGTDAAGAVGLTACRAAGLQDRQVEYLVDSGRWQSPYPRVFVTFSGPVPLASMQYAALLYAGEGAVLSHESAGVGYGLCPAPASIHLTVPYRRQVDGQPGLHLHRSRTITDADRQPGANPARTTIERTVLDLLRHKRTADAALGLVADAIRTRRTTAERLRAALLERPCTRWRRVVGAALPDIQQGAESLLELRDARIRRAHGLPMGTRQQRRLADGTEYLDVVVEEWGLHVELDGRLGHDRAREIWRDMRRDNRSELQRLRHLRYGWSDLVDRPCDVAVQQAMVLRQQGWRGPFRRCARCPDRLPAGL